MVTLWLSYYTIEAKRSTCHDLECRDLPLVPPRWQHKGKEVSPYTQMCVVKEHCHLDLYDILRNETTHSNGDVDDTYISIDLYFTCTNGANLGDQLSSSSC